MAATGLKAFPGLGRASFVTLLRILVSEHRQSLGVSTLRVDHEH